MNRAANNFSVFWGLLEYKPQWSLTWKAWLLLIVFAGLIFAFILTHIHSFLAVKTPRKAEALLIEGWVGDPVIVGGVEEFRGGNYQWLIVTGTPLYKGFFLTEYKNHAELAQATLIKLGINPEQIIAVAIPEVKKDRTAAMALAVKQQLIKLKLPIKAINIYSFDVHTRRSYLIYKKVLQPEVKVGAIAHINSSYEPQRWWTSSMGFRSVTEEAIAYFYARFIWKL
jgi:hypothetical protein